MSTPLAALGAPLQGQVVSAPAPAAAIEPTSVTDGKTNAISKVAEILKDIVYKAGVYHSEDAQRVALDAIDAFKRAFSTGNPLVLDSHRAAQDVPSKTPVYPAGAIPQFGVPAFQLDYDQLAAAILRAQSAQAISAGG
jgi:hypothetical protein